MQLPAQPGGPHSALALTSRWPAVSRESSGPPQVPSERAHSPVSVCGLPGSQEHVRAFQGTCALVITQCVLFSLLVGLCLPHLFSTTSGNHEIRHFLSDILDKCPWEKAFCMG